MSYEVRPPSVSASLGAGLGSGLGGQIPKEVERYRLSSGLKRFAEESKDIDPVEAMAQLSGIPGMTPQMIQSMGELLKRRSYGNALSQRARQQGQQVESGQRGSTLGFPNDPSIRENEDGQRSIQGQEKSSFLDKNIAPEDVASLISPENVEAALDPQIKSTPEELIIRAEQSPYYKIDAQGAIAREQEFDNDRVNRNKSLIEAGKIQEDQQQKISKGLKEIADKYKISNLKGLFGSRDLIPHDVFLGVENKAIKAVADRKMTPDQAIKHFSKEMNEIGKQYNDLAGLGNWLMIWGDPKQTVNNIDNIRDEFEKRGDLRNFRDSLVAENGLSFPMASAQTYKVQKNKEMYQDLKDLPKIDPLLGKQPSPEKQDQIFSNIIKKIDKNTSPLAVAHYLQRKGYDHTEFLKKVGKIKDKLQGWQGDELNKPFPGVSNLNDLYLMITLGVE